METRHPGGQSITCMATDEVEKECSHLITGCAAGYLRVWRVMDTFLGHSGHSPLYVGPGWRAHEDTISSMECFKTTQGVKIVTASSDMDIKIWAEKDLEF